MDHFESSRFLLEQSVENINSITDLIDKYYKNVKPIENRNVDLISGNIIIKQRIDHPVPPRIRYLAVTTIKGLRDALDQAARAIFNSLPGAKPKKIYFPICRTEVEFTKHKTSFPKGIHKTLELCEPYPIDGKENLLTLLHKLANLNKHELTFRVGAKLVRFLGSVQSENVVHMALPPEWDWKNGEMFIAELKSNGWIKYEMEIDWTVAFGDADVISGAYVEPLLINFFHLTNNIIGELERETHRLLAA